MHELKSAVTLSVLRCTDTDKAAYQKKKKRKKKLKSRIDKYKKKKDPKYFMITLVNHIPDSGCCQV